MQAVILAGGLGTRLLPRTETVPKALVPVLGVPFAAWQLSLIARQEVDGVVYCLGYLGRDVEDFVGDGSRWGVPVRYSHEDVLLGTGGALRLAYDAGLLAPSFFVLFGDSYLPVDFADVARAFDSSRCPALMTVCRSSICGVPGNADYESGRVVVYDKNQPGSLGFVDYGLTVMKRELVAERIPPAATIDLADVLKDLSLEGRLAGYEISTRFYEMGSPEGLKELEDYLQNHGARPTAS